MLERRTTREQDLDEMRSEWGLWMSQAQAGDAVAYERLLRALVPMLERFVRARLHDQQAAEDVVQNILLALHRARHTYRPERPFQPWIFAIARNSVIDSLRKQKVRRRFEQSLDGVPDPSQDTPIGPEPDSISPELARALAQLPAAQREAVELVKLHGLSMQEAAERAGTTAGALKVRAHRGYRKLRGLLEEMRTDP